MTRLPGHHTVEDDTSREDSPGIHRLLFLDAKRYKRRQQHLVNDVARLLDPLTTVSNGLQEELRIPGLLPLVTRIFRMDQRRLTADVSRLLTPVITGGASGTGFQGMLRLLPYDARRCNPGQRRLTHDVTRLLAPLELEFNTTMLDRVWMYHHLARQRRFRTLHTTRQLLETTDDDEASREPRIGTTPRFHL